MKRLLVIALGLLVKRSVFDRAASALVKTKCPAVERLLNERPSAARPAPAQLGESR